MNDHPSPANDALLEQLSAYLDGELDATASRELEALLARDEHARSELQRLEQAWRMLDELPRVELTGAFTRSTVEMIALQEAAVVEEHAQRTPVRRWLQRVAAAASIVIAACLGFSATNSWLDRSNRALVDDLPVIERLDAYRQIDSIEFLRQLKQEGLFVAKEPSRDR